MKTVIALFGTAVFMMLGACSGSSQGEVIEQADEPVNEQVNEQADEPVNEQANEQADEPVNEQVNEQANDDGNSARYRLTFDATWSEDSHPVLFPDSAHFSGLIGSVHNEQVIFWQRGDIATDGVRAMAETGDTSSLLDEVDAAIASGYALSSISGGGVGSSPGSVSVEFTVTPDFPLVTVTSMLAPSPDWFTGVHNYPLHDGQHFLQLQTVDLAVYDAGTDSGERYTSRDQVTSPRDPVSRVNSFPHDSPFLNGEPSIGRFTFEKL